MTCLQGNSNNHGEFLKENEKRDLVYELSIVDTCESVTRKLLYVQADSDLRMSASVCRNITSTLLNVSSIMLEASSRAASLYKLEKK